MRGIRIIVAAIVGVFAHGIAVAQAESDLFAIPTDWTVTIGVGGRVSPAFEGSDRYRVLPFPVFDLRRAGTPWQFSTQRDGWSFAIVHLGQFRFGPSVKVVLPRYESDDRAALRGLGSVNWAFEGGAFAEYWWLPWLRTRGEVRQGFGGHHGVIGEITADVVVPATAALTLSAGPRLTLATASALRPYFGVNPTQSIRSGLPVYTPGGGVKAYGAGAQARYQWSPQWATTMFVEYDRLTGDAARSPILRRNGSPDQVTVGMTVSYSFDISLR
jgi:outer membrane protein